MTHLNRRHFIAAGAALAAMPAIPALALTGQQAANLVNSLVNEINTVIASGRSEASMYREFERLFKKYGDTPLIAANVLGVAARRASNAQRKAFTEAFTGYIARKYGKRFREFQGGRIEVQSVHAISRGYEVRCVAHMSGSKTLETAFRVSDSNRFYNLFVEGADMLLSEKEEIGAMLDARRGNIDQLIADLRKAG